VPSLLLLVQSKQVEGVGADARNRRESGSNIKGLVYHSTLALFAGVSGVIGRSVAGPWLLV